MITNKDELIPMCKLEYLRKIMRQYIEKLENGEYVRFN